MIRHQIKQRYAYEGSLEDDAFSPTRYSLGPSTAHPLTSPVLASYDDVCPIHGDGCSGHLEEYEGCLFLPTCITMGSEHQPHPLMMAKLQCVAGALDYESYISQVLLAMRGKTGSMRQVNRMVVQGSLRMVISPASSLSAGTISIPHYVAQRTKLLCKRGSSYTSRIVKDGDYAILIRQPCMWSGAAQPVRVAVTPKQVHGEDDWDVNSSMRLPLSMCAPFAADYDGDEMTLFFVDDPASVSECRDFVWPHSRSSPYDKELMSQITNIVPAYADPEDHQAMCTTLTWLDRIRGVKVTKCHSKWMTKRSAFISFTDSHTDALALAASAQHLVTSICSKSSLQSGIGAISRRSKLGVERVSLNTRMGSIYFFGVFVIFWGK